MIGIVARQLGDKKYPVYMNLEKAARLVGVSRPTMNKLISSGKIEAHKGGGNWVVATRSVFDYLGVECEMTDA